MTFLFDGHLMSGSPPARWPRGGRSYLLYLQTLTCLHATRPYLTGSLFSRARCAGSVYSMALLTHCLTWAARYRSPSLTTRYRSSQTRPTSSVRAM